MIDFKQMRLIAKIKEIIYNGTTYTPISDGGSTTGHCQQFDEYHKVWRSVPRRCAKLFKKLFEYPDGCELVIVKK